MMFDGAGADEAGASRSVAGDPVDELDDLARLVHATFTRLRLTLAAAESCTGGLVGHLLTEVPGSSEYFLGGIVSYADRVKTSELGVPAEALVAHGAVSAQVAGAMATGVRRRFGADLAVAVTGIAGPGGGATAKPVGLTYVAVVDARGLDVRRYAWHGDRTSNKRESARAALELVLNRLEATRPEEPDAGRVHPSL
jgi:PncC family amidohydrolase